MEGEWTLMIVDSLRRLVEFDPRGLATLSTIVKQGTKILLTGRPFQSQFR
jgi:hypothetical protein